MPSPVVSVYWCIVYALSCSVCEWVLCMTPCYVQCVLCIVYCIFSVYWRIMYDLLLCSVSVYVWGYCVWPPVMFSVCVWVLCMTSCYVQCLCMGIVYDLLLCSVYCVCPPLGVCMISVLCMPSCYVGAYVEKVFLLTTQISGPYTHTTQKH